jgi:Insect cuticle protein
MKFIIVLALVIASAMALPAGDVTVLKSAFTNDGTSGYNFAFEQSDGNTRTEEGTLKNAGTETEAISVKGSFSFVDAEGKTYTVNYIADENGFQPTGDHLPVAPVA